MRIAFINPPAISGERWIESEDCCWAANRIRVIPSMLLNCASQVKDAVFIDLSIDQDVMIDADVVVYPLMWNFHDEIYPAMRKICKDKIQIVISVPFGYMNEYAHLKPSPFCVVYSEPEAVISALSNLKITDLKEWRDNTNGIAWVDNSGYHQSNRLPNCIDSLKDTDFTLIPEGYWKHYNVAVHQVTRGCPYRCHFCVWGGSTVTDKTFKMKEPAQVAREIESLRTLANKYRTVQDKSRPILLYILSAQLTTDQRWIEKFRELMMDKPYPYQSNVNAYELTTKKLELLKDSGMESTSIGVEALTDNLLGRLNKKHRLPDIEKSIGILSESGVRHRFHLRCGFGETPEDVHESIEIAKGLDLPDNTTFDLGPLFFYKGTMFYENLPCRAIRHRDYVPEVLFMKDIPKEWDEVARVLSIGRYKI